MAQARAGHLTFDLAAGRVGFTVDGSFSPGSGSLPILDFTYTEHLAGGEDVATIVSDGNTVTVDADGDERVLSADDASRLEGGTNGFADLGIASWVEGSSEDARDDTTVVTGKVDVADLLQDVVRLVMQVNAKGDVKPLDDATAGRLGDLAQTSTVEVVIGADGVPRSVDADVGFGRDVPDELVDALGPYAASELEVRVTFAPRR
ncbi:MAG: hypothetical protein QOD30_1433 [Actinomycetota bacterium]|nr:hypothetical protein [Actinomycetota bacterium]